MLNLLQINQINMKKLIVLQFCFLSLALSAQQPDTVNRLSVQNCIELALANNIDLKNSQLEINEAKAVKNAARTEYFPTVSAQALGFDAANPLLSFGIEDIDNAMVRQMLYTMANEYGYMWGYQDEVSMIQNGLIANVMATEPIYAGGRVRNGNKLAELGIEAAQYQEKVKEDEVVQQTECLYWQIVGLQEKIATLDQLDQLLDTLDKDLKGAVEAGLAMPTDQYKVTIKKNESQLNRKKVNDGIVLLKMLLGKHIGVDWQNMVLTDSLCLEASPEAYYHDAVMAVSNRNETHLLDLAVKAEGLKKKMTLGEALPSLMVGGSVNYHTVFNHDSPNALVFAMLQVPITDWHKTAYNLKKHDIATEIAENNRKDLSEQMLLQTNQAWFNVEQSWLRIEMAQASLKDAEANLKVETDYYTAGLVPLSDVLEAQTLLKKSHDELIDSRVDYQINLLKYKSLVKE